jgi:signal peptidase I
MENTLHINDRLLVNRLYYRLSQPRFQDVIVFRARRNIGVGPGVDFIQRCIGVPGDVIYSKGRHYYRNGRLI